MEGKGGEGGRIGPGEKPGCNADSGKAHSAPQREFCSRKGQRGPKPRVERPVPLYLCTEQLFLMRADSQKTSPGALGEGVLVGTCLVPQRPPWFSLLLIIFLLQDFHNSGL